MDESVFAVMYEFRRPEEGNSSRFDLDVVRTSCLEREIAKYAYLWRGDESENVTVAGVKKLPEDTAMFDYLDLMRVKYGGIMNLHLLTLDESSARRLINEEEFEDFLDVFVWLNFHKSLWAAADFLFF